MKPQSRFLRVAAALLVLACGQAVGQTLQRAYLDRQQRVHVVDGDGRDLRISGKRAIDLTLSPDRSAVAWLAVDARGQVASDQLRVYAGGRVRRIGRGPLVREFAFRADGRQLAVSFSGPRSNGWQELYDTRTMQVVDAFDEADPVRHGQVRWAVTAPDRTR